MLQASTMAWRHDILEGVERLPGGLLRRDAFARHIRRGFSRPQIRNVARAVREYVLWDNAHDGLRAGHPADQRIIDMHACPTIHAETFRLLTHLDEQQADMWIAPDVAETLEHPIA